MSIVQLFYLATLGHAIVSRDRIASSVSATAEMKMTRTVTTPRADPADVANFMSVAGGDEAHATQYIEAFGTLQAALGAFFDGRAPPERSSSASTRSSTDTDGGSGLTEEQEGMIPLVAMQLDSSEEEARRLMVAAGGDVSRALQIHQEEASARMMAQFRAPSVQAPRPEARPYWGREGQQVLNGAHALLTREARLAAGGGIDGALAAARRLDQIQPQGYDQTISYLFLLAVLQNDGTLSAEQVAGLGYDWARLGVAEAWNAFRAYVNAYAGRVGAPGGAAQLEAAAEADLPGVETYGPAGRWRADQEPAEEVVVPFDAIWHVDTDWQNRCMGGLGFGSPARHLGDMVHRAVVNYHAAGGWDQYAAAGEAGPDAARAAWAAYVARMAERHLPAVANAWSQ